MDKKTTLYKISIYLMVVVGTGSFVFLAVTAYLKISAHAQLRQTLLARHAAFNKVALFVEHHQGQWPKSWNDMVDDADLPQDRERIQALVTVDFSLKSEDVLKQDPNHFTAIQITDGRWRNVGDRHLEDAQDLIEYIRKCRSAPTSNRGQTP